MKKTTCFILAMLTVSGTKAVDGWPAGVREVRYPSTADKTEQPALFYSPDAKEPRPLLVGLTRLMLWAATLVVAGWEQVGWRVGFGHGEVEVEKVSEVGS